MNTQDDQELTSLLEEINKKSINKNNSDYNKEKDIKIRNNSYNKSTTSNCTCNITNHNISHNNLINSNLVTNKNTLSDITKKKIFKDNLIIELREELKHNKNFNKMYNKFLLNVIKLKNEVKSNRDKVNDNYNKLKKEFADKFDIIDNYENKIISLKEEKINIKTTNEDIIILKQNESKNLNKEIISVEKKIKDQRNEIEKLKIDVSNLENRKLHLDEEFKKIRANEEKDFKKLEKDYKFLQKKFEFYQEEYDEYEKIPEDLIKININFEDHSSAKRILKEENLNIKLVEKKLAKSNLLNSIDHLHLKIKTMDEERKAKMETGKKFGNSEKINTLRKSVGTNRSTDFKRDYSGRLKKKSGSMINLNNKKNRV